MARVKRRQVPPQYADYRKYKPYLRIDFRYRCCYCTIHELNWGSERHFAVEHFRPKGRFSVLETDYSNLYYACDVCNDYKGKKWPSDDDLASGRRFFDACVDFARLHFKANSSGELEPLSSCGAYSIAAIRLNRPLLLKMRNQRREYAIKFRVLLKEIRYFEATRPTADPAAVDVIDLYIKSCKEQLADFRDKYYRPPAPSSS
jgi:hypothetical protein